MVRPTLTDLNPVELKYYPFMISLNKCTGSCNVFSPETCVPKERNDINVTAFNMITIKNEDKAMTGHIWLIVNANSIVKYVTQIKSGIIKHVNVHVKTIVHVKKIIVGILAHKFVRIVST